MDDGDAIEEVNIPDASVNYPASNDEVVSGEKERTIKRPLVSQAASPNPRKEMRSTSPSIEAEKPVNRNVLM